MSINDRIEQLRNKMKEQGIDAYIIPSADAHQSEYVPEYYKSREWISGFTGSAGTAVITSDHAGLWTDSRYFIQAERELSESSFVLHKLDYKASSHYPHWLAENLGEDSTIGFDPKTITIENLKKLKKKLSSATSFSFSEDLIDQIWTERPDLPKEQAYELTDSMTGKSRTDKVSGLQNYLDNKNADHLLIPTLDDIAWIFNMRGTDVEFNPVTLSYAIISKHDSHLFINDKKLKPVFADRLMADNVQIHDYESISNFLENISKSDKLILDPELTSVYLGNKLNCKIQEEKLPSRSMKAIKNEVEIKHIKNAMIKDGVALTKAFMWLEENINNKNITEYDFARKIAECRATQDNYKGESFNAIVGYRENGAIVHYKPMAKSSSTIEPNGILLCDSGGHYTDGTTDITRTIALSEPSIDIKKNYSLVLKGHINLNKTIFPAGTHGIQLDVQAREYLWKHGLNYGHGTGHGVGFFLNVHEAPQGFTEHLDKRGKSQIKAGMISSNEPGYYKEGHYGIRIENLILCKEAEHENFYTHEDLTLFPIDTDLIYLEWMTEEEVKWLNSYHRRVKRILLPELNENEKEWMKKKCSPIQKPVNT